MQAFDRLANMPKGTVLDVGARSFDQKDDWTARGYEWVGTDMVEAPGIKQCKMEDMSCFEDNTFDIVFCCHALEHCERPIDALREMKRVCKDGGVIFVSTPLPCYHHILGADYDHIMVMSNIQMRRWFNYCGIALEHQWIETNTTGDIKDDSLITIGRKV